MTEAEQMRIAANIAQANGELVGKRLDAAIALIADIRRAVLDGWRPTSNGTAVAKAKLFDKVDAFLSGQQDEKPECGCCGQTGPCDADCDTRQHPEQAEGAQDEGAEVRTIVTDALLGMISAVTSMSPPPGAPLPDFIQAPIDRAVTRIGEHIARAALAAQPSPAPEMERPEVVGTFDGLYIIPLKPLEKGDELMTVAQHERIVAALRAEIERWHEASEQAMQLNIGSRKELRATIRERDALQVKLDALEKQAAVAWMWRIHANCNWAMNAGWDSIEAQAAQEMEERGWEVVRLYAAPVAQAGQVPELLEWAVQRWMAEVSNRPLHNVHRRALDDTWRQIIRRLGGDTGLLCGPVHDELLAAAPAPEGKEHE
ncbi:hypothetical protein D9M71_38980 [compost metagenome]